MAQRGRKPTDPETDAKVWSNIDAVVTLKKAERKLQALLDRCIGGRDQLEDVLSLIAQGTAEVRDRNTEYEAAIRRAKDEKKADLKTAA